MFHVSGYTTQQQYTAATTINHLSVKEQSTTSRYSVLYQLKKRICDVSQSISDKMVNTWAPHFFKNC